MATPTAPKRDWNMVTVVHTAAATGVIALGASILLLPKGTRAHRFLGRAWSASMLVTCISSFGIRDLNNGHFSWIHGLSAFTLYCVGAGIYNIRRKPRDLRRHISYMRGSYVGAVAAGAFAVFSPGRLLYQDLFSPANEPYIRRP
jgi:uncharacterized membrane protein